MPKCKQCETKYSIWTGCGDGLCKTCHAKAVAEADRKETERKQQVLTDTKATIDSVVRAIAGDEQPVCVVFLNENIQQKSRGFLQKLPGMVAGVAIGGAMGEMIFGGSLLSNKTTYIGQLSILVVTATRLLIGYCADTPFFEQSGEINLNHLQLLQAKCKTNTIGRVVLPISSSQVSATDARLTIDSGDDFMSFNRSKLYVDGLYQTPSLPEVSEQVRETKAKIQAQEDLKTRTPESVDRIVRDMNKDDYKYGDDYEYGCAKKNIVIYKNELERVGIAGDELLWLLDDCWKRFTFFAKLENPEDYAKKKAHDYLENRKKR